MLKRLLSRFSKRSGVVATGSLTDTDDFWYNLAGFVSSAGVQVSKESAMRQWAVYACISIIAETLAQLPLKLKRPDGSGGTEDATDHPLYDLCKNLPNKQMTSFNWREAQQVNLLTTGNCYNFVQRKTVLGDVTAIWPIAPSSVVVRTASGQEVSKFRLPQTDRIVYEVSQENGKKVYPARDILHVAGMGWNGLMGESVITNFAKQTIGNAIGLDGFQSSALKNGVFPSGVLEHPSTLGDNKEKFLKALEERYSGVGNFRRPMVLEAGMTFKEVDVNMVDKQFVEQLKMSATQVCGIFKVPPHKVAIFEKNTNYNNTEQGNRAFLDGTMQQWVIRWEQAMNWKLLTDAERREGYYFKFNFDGLLRPDAKTRSEIAWREWQMGTPLNEIRQRNDMNPIEGGETAYVPVNMIPSSLAGKQIEASIKAQDENKDELVEKDVDSVRRWEKNAVTRLVEKEISGKTEDFEAKLDEIYNRVEQMLDRDTMAIIRCFQDRQSAKEAIEQLKQEFRERRRTILELMEREFEGVENVW